MGAVEVTRRVVPIERASTADLALLAMESGSAVPEHLGALIVLDTGPTFDVESAQRVLAERIRAVPRLRQRLVRLPYGCGRPVWVDDPGFNATRHVRLRRCPPPGDEQTLLDVAADDHQRAVAVVPPAVGGRPRARPGRRPGRARTGAAPRPGRRHRRPGDTGPPRRRGRARADQDVPAAVPDAAPTGSRGVAVPAALARPVPRRWARPRTSAAVGGPVPRAVACSILQVTGTRRRFAVARTDLVALHAAGRRHGGTVNDVLLTAVGGALHTLLEGRGEHVETFRIAVMVAGEKEASADVPGNQAVPLIVDVPGTGTPTERLARMSGAVRAARASTAGRSPAAIPPTLLRFLAAAGLYRLYMRHQHRLHTLVSNVHGPDRPLTLNGARSARSSRSPSPRPAT